MPHPRATIAIALSVLLAAATGCGGGGGGGQAPPAGGRHPETLEALLQDLVKANLAGDAERVRDLTFSMIPTTADLRQVLREGPATETFLAKFPTKDLPESAAKDAAPHDPKDRTRTEIHVHAATTEELVRYEEGSVAWKEFPGGMRRFAREVAAPGRTWYCVEFVEPGKDMGTKYTAFTRLGDRFLIVVKPWRSIPEDGR